MTVEAGLIDADHRSLIYVLLFNHSEKAFTVRTGERIAQVVFLEKFDANFEKVSKKEELGATKRGSGGFSSTGITVIKKIKLSEEEKADNLEITAEENVISVNDFFIIEMLVKTIYMTLFFFFLQDVIDLIFCICVGYLFGHFFFYIFIKNKARKKNLKDITDFFEKYEQRMAEKPTTIEEKFESLTNQAADPRKEFLLNLDRKLRAKFKDCIIEFNVSEKLISFSFETYILNSRPLAEKLIDTVDDHLKKEFFPSNGLAKLGWCAKYILHSDTSRKPNGLKTQVVQFTWSRNLYRHKLCPCFICDSFKNKYNC